MSKEFMEFSILWWGVEKFLIFFGTTSKDYQQIDFNVKIRNFVELIEERNEVGSIISEGPVSGNLTIESLLEQRFAALNILILSWSIFSLLGSPFQFQCWNSYLGLTKNFPIWVQVVTVWDNPPSTCKLNHKGRFWFILGNVLSEQNI